MINPVSRAPMYPLRFEPIYQYPAREAGVPSIQVRDPDETKRVIETLLACLERPEGATGG